MQSYRLAIRLLFVICTVVFTACQTAAPPSQPEQEIAEIVLPTIAVAAATLTPQPTNTAAPTLPPTWTPEINVIETATPLGEFVFTPQPSNTPWPTFTATSTETSVPTETPTPSETPTTTAVPQEVATSTPTLQAASNNGNWLPNGSFEEGWYHPNGDPELQIPEQWRFEFDEGANSLDPDSWNAWVRPEVRVLSADFLPPHEHELFIWDGDQTVKIFKGSGSISVRLLNTVILPPGTYKFNVQLYPDLVSGYDESGGKIWADDELSGEVRLIVGDYQSGWELPSFGRKNNFSHTFTISEGQSLTVGVAIRGRWALANNGWFMDDWSITAVE